MNKKNRKKGFTLVELIVVIAIIAILAAVAVPTTMHFVDKANVSNTETEIGIHSQISDAIGVMLVDGNLAIDATANNKLTAALNADTALLPNLKKIATIELKFVQQDGKDAYVINCVITAGNDVKKPGLVREKTLSGAFTASQLFEGGATTNAAKTVKFVVTNGVVAEPTVA